MISEVIEEYGDVVLSAITGTFMISVIVINALPLIRDIVDLALANLM